MSLPRITPRAIRVIQVEYDPYHVLRRDAALINRKVYEDGSHALFVDKLPVHSVCYQPHYPNRHSIALLEIADGPTIRLEGVSYEEGTWLQESIGRPQQ